MMGIFADTADNAVSALIGQMIFMTGFTHDWKGEIGMAEYIEREELLDAIVTSERLPMSAFQIGVAVARKIVKHFPAADVAPVVHGRWLPVNGHWGPKIVRRGYQCSLCGRIENQREPYCHCGAKMDLRGEDNDGSEKA